MGIHSFCGACVFFHTGSGRDIEANKALEKRRDEGQNIHLKQEDDIKNENLNMYMEQLICSFIVFIHNVAFLLQAEDRLKENGEKEKLATLKAPENGTEPKEEVKLSKHDMYFARFWDLKR